jgi:hypothetical protein
MTENSIFYSSLSCSCSLLHCSSYNLISRVSQKDEQTGTAFSDCSDLNGENDKQKMKEEVNKEEEEVAEILSTYP